MIMTYNSVNLYDLANEKVVYIRFNTLQVKQIYEFRFYNFNNPDTYDYCGKQTDNFHYFSWMVQAKEEYENLIYPYMYEQHFAREGFVLAFSLWKYKMREQWQQLKPYTDKMYDITLDIKFRRKTKKIMEILSIKLVEVVNNEI